MRNTHNICRLHKFINPLLHCPYTHSKDFRLLHSVLLGEAIVRVRGRDKKSAGSISNTKKATLMDGFFRIIIEGLLLVGPVG